MAGNKISFPYHNNNNILFEIINRSYDNCIWVVYSINKYLSIKIYEPVYTLCIFRFKSFLLYGLIESASLAPLTNFRLSFKSTEADRSNLFPFRILTGHFTARHFSTRTFYA